MKLITTILILTFSFCAAAQVNVEKFRGKDSINLGASYSQDETRTSETDTLYFNFLASKNYGKHEILGVAGSTVADKNDENYKDQQFFHARYFFNIKNWGPEFFYQFAENDFSNQRRRQLAGAGVRKILLREKDSFRGGVSIFSEELRMERKSDDVSFIEDLDMTRGNLYFNYTREILSATVYYQPNLENSGEYNIALESLLTFDLWKDRFHLDIIYNIIKNKTLDIENSSFKQVLRFQF